MLSEHPQNPFPSLPANRSRLTCHNFYSETLKKQELQPLTLTCPGTSELIEISLFALWSALKKLDHSVRKFLLLFAEPLVIRPRFLKPKEEAN